MSTLQKVSNLNVVQWLGTRKSWVWPAALAMTALIQSGALGFEMASEMQNLATGITWVGALLTQWHDAERDKRMGA